MTELDWSPVAAQVRHVDDLVAAVVRTPVARHILDQEAAALRDRLDAVGLSVTDPVVQLAGLIFCGELVERIHRHTSNHLTRCVARSSANGIVAALLDHLPPEARQ